VSRGLVGAHCVRPYREAWVISSGHGMPCPYIGSEGVPPSILFLPRAGRPNGRTHRSAPTKAGCYPPGAARDETPKPDARRGALHAPSLDVIDGKGIGKEKGACIAPLRMGAR
jgi:hypothetical protein